MLTHDQIEHGRRNVSRAESKSHDHEDCVRLAYEWLDAQVKTKSITRKRFPLKHLIEAWASRYVSTDDVQVAAFLHPAIHGHYPCFNISARLTWPAPTRLDGIAEAGKHPGYATRFQDIYDREEGSLD
mgnify:CR=1 FL=1